MTFQVSLLTEDTFTIINPSPTAYYAWYSFPLKYKGYSIFKDGWQMQIIHATETELRVLIYMEAFAISQVRFVDEGIENDEYSLVQIKEALPKDAAGFTLQNGSLSVKVSHQGSILSIRDENREYLAGESNLVQLWEDEPNNWGAWDINHFYKETPPSNASQVELIDAFALGDYQCVVQKLSFGASTILQTVELHPHSKHVIVKHEVDWQEHHKMLRAAFETDIFSQEVECGVQMGKLKRSCRPKNSWEAARFDFPAQHYVALKQPDAVCAILSGAKYGFSAHEKRLEIALLRSPADVDPTADIGQHSYSYGFFCGDTHEDYVDLHHIAQSLDLEPLCFAGACELESLQPGLDTAGQIISGIKPAYDGSGIVIRFYEALGQNTKNSLMNVLEPKRIQKCTLLEEPVEELLRYEDFAVKPFEIITLKLELTP